jgi:mutator protein MutT
MKLGIDYIGVSVGAIIVNEKGEVLLCKRSQHTKNEKGCWECPGGAVKFGETLEDAIKREMKEELDIEIALLKQFPAANHILPLEKQHWIPTAFVAKIIYSGTPKIMEQDKCDAIGWFSLSQFPSPLSLITQIDIDYYKAHYSQFSYSNN